MRGRGPAGRANVEGWVFVLAVLLVAEGAVRLLDLSGSVAAPSAALRALADGLWAGDLASALGSTLVSYAQGFGIALALGIPLGVAIGASRTVDDASSVAVEFLRPIPGVALIPVAILAFGLGTPMLRVVVAYAAVWPVLLTTAYAVRGVDRVLHDVAATSGVTGGSRLVRVTLPAALPGIATGVRTSAAIALVVCVTAEFWVGGAGLGGYMQAQQVAYRLPELYAAVALTGLLGLAVDTVLKRVERRALPWVGEEQAVRA